MKHRIAAAFVVFLAGWAAAGPVDGAPTRAALEKLAAGLAEQLSTLCPNARGDDVDAHGQCADGLRHASFIPFAPGGLLFGADQPRLPLSKKRLTHFNPGVFQLMYLSLFTFTGHWSVDVDDRARVGVIHLEAYFRNALPPGAFPYPFWHSADKWNDYEAANELKCYLGPDGRVFVVTRSRGGSEADRGPFAHVAPPAFDGHWQWVDASGQIQPRASLFSNRYGGANPYLAALNKAYRDFAAEARKGTCLDCHTPSNEAGMDHLVLLQTPLHAAGEIDRVLEEVRNQEMPQDDLGLRKQIAPDLRAAILRTGEAFRKVLGEANQWEAKPHHGEN